VPWYPVCSSTEIAEGGFRTVTLLGKRIAVFLRRGEFYAISAMCRHQGADLTRGVRNGDVFTCPRHHWRHDLYTGECLSEPGLTLPRYALRIREGRIEVEVGGEYYD